MTDIVEVPFDGDSITTFETDDGVFVPVKPLAERLGIDWKSQHRKLKAEDSLWGMVILWIPSAGGEQETTCIPLNRIAAWLFSISPRKVKPELREKVEAYRTRAADVLDRHFRLREHEHAVSTRDLEERNAVLSAYTLAFNPLWNKIARLAEAGESRYGISSYFPRRRWVEIWQAIKDMERLGLIASSRALTLQSEPAPADAPDEDALVAHDATEAGHA